MAVDFKSEEEVREYLANLLIEYKFGCYKEKIPKECQMLGDYREGIQMDYEEAAKIYKENCDNYDYALSCRKYGIYKFVGKGCKRNVSEAIDYFRKSCNFDDERGCYLAGGALTSDEFYKDKSSEKEKAAQVTEGMSLLQRACITQKVEQACFILAGIYYKGIDNCVEINRTKAFDYSLKSCELKNPAACAAISHMYAKGDGVEKNVDLADAFKKRSIELIKEIKEAPSVQFQQGID